MKRAVIGLSALGLLAACGGKSQNKTLQIGVIISQTGAYGERGPERLQGVQLAADEINANGGILGQQIELVARDDGTNADQAKAKAQELVDLKVPVIIGASASRATIGASTVTIPAQVVQISGSSTSPAITALQDNGFVNRTCPSDALQGKLLAEQAHAKGFTKVSVMYTPGDAYAEGLANAFSDAFTGLGGTVNKVQVNTGQTSYQAELTQAYATNPDGILLSVYPPEGTQVMKDYLSGFASTHSTFWYFPDSLSDESFITGVGATNFANIQHEGTAPGAPKGPRADAFNAAFTAKYGSAPHADSFAANFYDAMYLAALATEAAGAANGPAIRDHLADVSKGKAAGAKVMGPADFKDAVAALHNGADINYEGASGSVDMDGNGDVVAPYDLWQVQNGAVTVTQSAVNP